jgi:hypothetical protein
MGKISNNLKIGGQYSLSYQQPFVKRVKLAQQIIEILEFYCSVSAKLFELNP